MIGAPTFLFIYIQDYQTYSLDDINIYQLVIPNATTYPAAGKQRMIAISSTTSSLLTVTNSDLHKKLQAYVTGHKTAGDNYNYL